MRKQKILMAIGGILLSISVAGCVTPQTQADLDQRLAEVQKQEAALVKKDQQLSQLQAAVSQKEAKLSAKEAELKMTREAAPVEAGTLFPPNANPGECWARVFVPPNYEYRKETLLKHEAKEIVETIPPKFEIVEERVLVKETSKRMEVIPAQYEWIEETVMVEPEKRELVPVPAEYETITEKVLVREESIGWKKGTGPIQKVDEITGEIMCLVKEPAVYQTVSKRVLKKPATTREVVTPAKYKTVKRKVMTSPPQTKVIEIPAEYGAVKVTKLVEPAKSTTRTIPAEYQTVERRVMVSQGGLEWQEILCQTNMTKDRITEIQRALKSAGYDPGPIDGVIGHETMGAVNKYQADKKLPVTKYLTLETLEALRVAP